MANEPLVYCTPDYRLYLVNATTDEVKMQRIEEIISSLMDSMLSAATNMDVTEYQLDDGQTKVRTIYRSVNQIKDAIEGLEATLEMYKQRVQGRIVKLRNHESSRR